MGKLVEKLRKNFPSSEAKQKRHRVNFLAHKADIIEALLEGWSAKQIWTQMVEECMTAMSYSSFCAHIRKEINPTLEINTEAPAKRSPESSRRQPAAKHKKRQDPSTEELKGLPESERLELLRNEALASVRAPKPSGPLIGAPKSREEENRELFGE